MRYSFLVGFSAVFLLATQAYAGPIADRIRNARHERAPDATQTPSADEKQPLQTMMFDGVERSYLLVVPPQVMQRREKVALIINLHGGGGNAEIAEKMSGMTEKAMREGFIVVYPSGTGGIGNHLLTWNSGHCCGSAMKKKVDDVGFIRALIDELASQYPIDTKRVYATGMSNGGLMAHRLGMELSDKIAAIAPIVAGLVGDEPLPKSPVSAIMFNGVLDKNVPYAGGPPGGSLSSYSWDGSALQPGTTQGAFWAKVNGCDASPSEHVKDGNTISAYHCPAGREVIQYLIADNGHAWPGGQKIRESGDEPSQTVNATDVMWAFFKAHPKP